jgi:hypothetical protein
MKAKHESTRSMTIESELKKQETHANIFLGNSYSGCDFFRKYTETQIRIGRCTKVFSLHSKELEGKPS